MAELKIGDRVQTLDSQGKPIYSDVIAFLHRQERATADYLSIAMDNGRSLRVSNKHLVFRIDNTTHQMSSVFASDIKSGDRLQTAYHQQGHVDKITVTTQVGVYAPLTRHGTMIVDGVLVSCYAHWNSHTVAHLSMAPLRLWTDVTSLLTSSFRSLFVNTSVSPTKHFEGIHWYAAALMKITQNFVLLN
jgi:hypothetical protein